MIILDFEDGNLTVTILIIIFQSLDFLSPNPKSRAANRRVSHNKSPRMRSGSRKRTTTESGDSVLGPAQEVMDVSFPLSRTLSTTYTTVQSNEILSVFSTNTTTNSYLGLYFLLNSFANANSFANTFDQYRIERLEVTLYSNSIFSQSGLMTVAIDYDNSAPPSSIGAVLSYNTAQTKAIGASFKRTWIPHVDLAAYSSSGFTSTANKSMQWIDSNSPSVQHYGLVIAATPSSAAVIYDAVVRAVVSFRNNI